MEYSELEKKVIKKGKDDFRKELQIASKPMLSVLKKYGIKNGHKLLNEIKLIYPYSPEGYFEYAVNIPVNDGLDLLNSKILEMFMNDINEIKEKIEYLE